MDQIPSPDMLAIQRHLADASVIADIESTCDRILIAGTYWWDTRVMLDPREQCDDMLEMNRQALRYAQWRGLITPDPDAPHLVRIHPPKGTP
jgi:hypothetical protein